MRGVNIASGKHSELTEKVIGVYYSVYNELGPGFLESIYQKAMIIALREVGLEVTHEVAIPVWFRGSQIGDFKADLIVNGCILLELKAVERMQKAHEAQTLNYLKATALEVALLMNFGWERPEFKRFAYDNSRKPHLVRAAKA
jgi:GxxExxY protein